LVLKAGTNNTGTRPNTIYYEMDFMKLTFKIINNPSCGTPSEKTITFGTGVSVIGRNTSCDWVLPDPDRFISSRHAEVFARDNQFFLKDISSNGTINGLTDENIGHNQELVISEGQTFLVGDYLIQANIQHNSLSDNDHSTASLATEHANWDNQMDDFWGNSSDPLDLLAPNRNSIQASEAQQTTPSLANSIERTPAFKQAMSFSEKSTSTTPISNSNAVIEGIPENWDNTSFSFPEEQVQTELPNEHSIESDSSFFQEDSAPENLPTNNTATATHSEINDILNDDDDFFSGIIEDSLYSEELPPAINVSTNATPSAIAQERPSMLERPANARPRKRKNPEVTTKQASPSSNDNLLAAAKNEFQQQGYNPTLLTEEVATQWLALMPTVMQSTIELLQARAAIKNEFRVSKTLLTTTENNPLKFSSNAEDAINSLFHHKRPGFLSSDLAFQQAFKDINQHQSALLHGVRVAMMDLLKQFDAQSLEDSFNNKNQSVGLLDKFSSTKSSQAKLWQQYKDLYNTEYKVDSDDSFQRIFGETFAQAYDEYSNHD
jgi:type VI secretion system protein